MEEKPNKYIASIQNVESLPKMTIHRKDGHQNLSSQFKYHNLYPSNRGQIKSIINTNNNSSKIKINAKLKKELNEKSRIKKDEIHCKNFNFDDKRMKSQLSNNNFSKIIDQQQYLPDQHRCHLNRSERCKLPKEKLEQSYLSHRNNQPPNSNLDNVDSFGQNLNFNNNNIHRSQKHPKHHNQDQHHQAHNQDQSIMSHNYYSNDNLFQTSTLVSISKSVPTSLPLTSLSSNNSFTSTSSYFSAKVSSNLNSNSMQPTTNVGGNIITNDIIVHNNNKTNQQQPVLMFEHKKHYEETDLDEMIKTDIGNNILTLPIKSNHCDNISDQLNKISLPKSSNSKKLVKTLSNLFSRNKSINSKYTFKELERQQSATIANGKNYSTKRAKEFFSNSRKLFNFSNSNATDRKDMKIVKNQAKPREFISEQNPERLPQKSGIEIGPLKNKNKFSLSLHNLQHLNWIDNNKLIASSRTMPDDQQINLNSSEDIFNDNNNNQSKINCNYESSIKNNCELSQQQAHQFFSGKDYAHSNRQSDQRTHSTHDVRLKKAISTCDNYGLMECSNFLVDSNSCCHSGLINQLSRQTSNNTTSMRWIGSDGESEYEVGSSNLSDECSAKSMGPNMVNSIDSDDTTEICKSNLITNNKKSKQSFNIEMESFYRNENLNETPSKTQTASLSSLFVSRLKRTASMNKSNSFKSIVGDRNDKHQIETRSFNDKSTLMDNRQYSLRNSLIMKPSKTPINKLEKTFTSTSNIPTGINKNDLNNSVLRSAATRVLLRKNRNKKNKSNVNELHLKCQNISGQSELDQTNSNDNNTVCIRNRAIDLISKRLSLPADIKLPASFLAKVERELELINSKNGHANDDDSSCSTKSILKNKARQIEENNFIFALLNTDLDKPISNEVRRKSLCEIGFGRLETYTKLEKLGQGTYASVYKGRSHLTDKLLALKIIRFQQKEGTPCTAIREVSILKKLKHCNIVTLHDVIYSDQMLILVFEYMPRDLSKYMSDCRDFVDFHNVKLFMFQLLRGLEYCHKRSILHRDIKPQNLLISERGELKLADFGLARSISVPTKTLSSEVVTLWYRPPDVLHGSTNYSSSIDIWGSGCIFFELLTGEVLFNAMTDQTQMELIDKTFENNFNSLTTLPRKIRCRSSRLDNISNDLMFQLLRYNPQKRIDAGEAMKHKYFSTLDPMIYTLSDQTSIFSISSIFLHPDAGIFSKNSFSNISLNGDNLFENDSNGASTSKKVSIQFSKDQDVGVNGENTTETLSLISVNSLQPIESDYRKIMNKGGAKIDCNNQKKSVNSISSLRAIRSRSKPNLNESDRTINKSNSANTNPNVKLFRSFSVSALNNHLFRKWSSKLVNGSEIKTVHENDTNEQSSLTIISDLDTSISSSIHKTIPKIAISCNQLNESTRKINSKFNTRTTLTNILNSQQRAKSSSNIQNILTNSSSKASNGKNSLEQCKNTVDGSKNISEIFDQQPRSILINDNNNSDPVQKISNDKQASFQHQLKQSQRQLSCTYLSSL